jgi:hypothetical protein
LPYLQGKPATEGQKYPAYTFCKPKHALIKKGAYYRSDSGKWNLSKICFSAADYIRVIQITDAE